jgi:hypothetical protein
MGQLFLIYPKIGIFTPRGGRHKENFERNSIKDASVPPFIYFYALRIPETFFREWIT